MSDTPPFTLSQDGPLGISPPKIDTEVVRDLARILKETDLTTIEVEQGGLRIRVAREVTVQAVAQIAAPAPVTAAAVSPSPSAQPSSAAEPSPARAGDEVKSPMVGTVYLQPQPGAAPFVKVGDKVSEGQTLVLVEAMKTMNPIPAPRAGTVTALLVGDQQPVEYGEPLVVIE